MKIGRPTLGQFHTVLVNFKVPYDIWRQFQARCERNGVTASAQLRALIDEWLKLS